jgi:WD40 repeat protein
MGMTDLAFNPYVGPRAFEEDEYRQFFGRDDEIRQLTSLVISHKVVLFYAPSGAGKTSLIKAGIIPRLNERKKIQVLPVTRLGGGLAFEGPRESNVYVFNTLMNLMGENARESDLVDVRLEKGLESHFNSEKEQQRTPFPKLLIIDQFEEIFTTYPDRYDDRADFFFQLQQCLDQYPRLSLLLAMREDFIAQLDYYAAQINDRLRTRFRMELLGEKNALEAVKRPAERADRKFDNAVAEKLVENLRRLQAGAKRGITSPTETILGKYVEPVHLQIVCRQLWDSLKPDSTLIKDEDVQEFGDVDHALKSYYQSAVQKVVRKTGLRENRIRTWIDDRLTTQDNTRNMVYRGEMESSGLPNEAVDILNDTYLIRAVPRGDNTWYELAHDRLIAPILKDNEDWRETHLSILQRQAAIWVKENKPDGLLLKGKALKDAELWVENHPDEITDGAVENEFLKKCLKARKTERLFHVLFGLCVCLTVILLLALGFVIYYSKAADEQKRIAEKQARIADSRRLATEASAYRANYPQRSLLLAIEALWVTAEAGDYRVTAAEQALRESLSTIGGRGFSGHEGAVTTLAISNCSRWLVTGSDDNTALLWDLKANDPASTPIVLTGHTGAILAVSISSDSRWMVTGSIDETARVWDLKSEDPAKHPKVLRGHIGGVTKVVICSDSRWLVTLSWDGTAFLWDLKSDSFEAEPIALNDNKKWIVEVAISIDSRWLTVGNYNGTADLWDLKSENPTSKTTVFLGHKDAITEMTISTDSKWLVTGSDDKTVRLWNLSEYDSIQEPIAFFGHKESITAVILSSDTRWLLTASFDKIALLWDLKTEDPAGKPIVLYGHEGYIMTAAISPDNRWLATGSSDGTTQLWDLKSEKPGANPIVLHSDQNSTDKLAISADSRWLVTTGDDKMARIWDLKSNNPKQEPKVLQGHEDVINGLTISADSRWIVTGSKDNTVRLWHLKSHNPISAPIVLRGHKRAINAADISADNKWLATGGDDKVVLLWDLSADNPSEKFWAFRGHDGSITSLAISDDSHWLVTVSDDNEVLLWDLTTENHDPKPVALDGHEDSITSLAISADSRWLVTGSMDKTARVWDMKAKSPEAKPIVLKCQIGGIADVAISSDNLWVVTMCYDRNRPGFDMTRDKTALLWNLTANNISAEPIFLRGHKVSFEAFAISPDSRWLATGSVDRTVRLWDLKADSPAANSMVLRGHNGSITALAISTNNHWLVSGSWDKTARIWDLKAENPEAESKVLKGHEDGISALAISPDSRWIVTVSYDLRHSGFDIIRDKNAWLWTLPTDRVESKPIVLSGHEGSIRAIAISADSRYLVTGSWDGTARVWHLKPEDLVEIACRTAGRSLTRQEWNLYIGDKPYRETCAPGNVAELAAALKKISTP